MEGEEGFKVEMKFDWKKIENQFKLLDAWISVKTISRESNKAQNIFSQKYMNVETVWKKIFSKHTLSNPVTRSFSKSIYSAYG